MQDIARKLEPWIIFFGSLALFLYGMFGREFIGFETRFALFAQEMLRNGPSFFPTTYGLPYPDYPAGLTFLNYLCALPFGKLTTFSGIFPTALASACTLVLIYEIALPIDRHMARIAVLLTLLTYEFLNAGRSLSMDPLIMLACTFAFYLTTTRQASQIFLLIPLIFGFLIRGPIGLILPTAVVIVTQIAYGQWKNIIPTGIRACVILAILMALLLLAAAHQGGLSFVGDVLRMQIFGRLHTEEHTAFFSYFTNSFANYAITYELALISMVLWLLKRREKFSEQDRFTLALILWVGIVLIGMSIPPVRKIRYIMPIIPALSLLSAQLFVSDKKIEEKICRGIYLLCFLLPFISLILTIASILVAHLKGLAVNAHFFTAFCTLGFLAILSTLALWHHPMDYSKRNPKKVLGLGIASICAVLIFVAQPINQSISRIKPFVNHVLENMPPNTTLSFYQLDPDTDPILFMSGLPRPISVQFTHQIDWKNTHQIYITRASIFDALPAEEKDRLKVILREKLGHHDMVVFNEALP